MPVSPLMIAEPAPPPYTPPSYADVLGQLREGPVYFDGVGLELVDALQTEILQLASDLRRRSTPSLNRNGWKSSEDYLDRAGAAQILRLKLEREFLGGARAVGWAMVNRLGSEHPRHQHRIASISGIYYIMAGDPPVPTMVELAPNKDQERVIAARKRQGMPPLPGGLGSEVAIEPIPGRLLLMRGETWHRVAKYQGQVPRLTIAFDVRR